MNKLTKTSPIIEVKNLSCKAGYRYLLQNINWTVNEGEHWVVFGMNGCGKTTLLSIIAGFNAATHGELKVFDEEYTQENILDFRRRIGWVSSSFFDKNLTQESALDIVLSGKFGTLGLGYDITNQDVIKAQNLLQELRLGDKVNCPFHLMSKGERQNVLIARAFMGDPEILVLDEPGTGLDVFAREYMLSTIDELAKKSNMTIIYVTHYTEEILDVFDNCMLMRDGCIYQQGNTKELFTEENMSKFLQYPVTIEQNGDRMQVRMQVKSKLYEMTERGGIQYGKKQ